MFKLYRILQCLRIFFRFSNLILVVILPSLNYAAQNRIRGCEFWPPILNARINLVNEIRQFLRFFQKF